MDWRKAGRGIPWQRIRRLAWPSAGFLPERTFQVKLADTVLSLYLGDPHRPKSLENKLTALAGQLLAQDSESFDGLRLTGDIAVAQGEFKITQEYYRRANQVKPMQPEVTAGWTRALFQTGRSDEAEKVAFDFIDKNKTFTPIYDTLYNYYLQNKKIADAEKTLALRCANNPADAASVLQLAEFYAGQSRASDSQALLQRMLGNPQAFPRAHMLAGDFYSRSKKWNQAIDQYRAGAAANSRDRSQSKEKVVYLKRIVVTWLAQGKGAQAYPFVDEILAANPEDEAAQSVKASWLLSTRKPDDLAKAVSLYQALVEKSPDNAVWHFELARALAVKGNRDGARKQFQEAVNRRADFLEPRLNKVWTESMLFGPASSRKRYPAKKS